MQLSTVSAELSGSSVWKTRPWALSLDIYFSARFLRRAYQVRTYTQQALYDHPVGRVERTGKTEDPPPPPPAFWV